MFGYVRPLIPELKVGELERFRAMYCALCHTLGREFGIRARLILNYDFVFLATLLSGDEKTEFCLKRCPIHPLKKRCVCCEGAYLSESAGYSVILTYWKLKDSAKDERGAKRAVAAVGAFALERAYRRACARWPDFDCAVKSCLAELDAVECGDDDSLDRAADTFARILSSAADGTKDAERRRILKELLYHTGRWIYINDAYDDLEHDAKSGSYNPILRRFCKTSRVLDEDQKNILSQTLMRSEEHISAALELLPDSRWTPILRNIIYLGMPDVRQRVADGTYSMTPQRLPRLEKII